MLWLLAFLCLFKKTFSILQRGKHYPEAYRLPEFLEMFPMWLQIRLYHNFKTRFRRLCSSNTLNIYVFHKTGLPRNKTKKHPFLCTWQKLSCGQQYNLATKFLIWCYTLYNYLSFKNADFLHKVTKYFVEDISFKIDFPAIFIEYNARTFPPSISSFNFFKVLDGNIHGWTDWGCNLYKIYGLILGKILNKRRHKQYKTT